ncbi:MAG TPA: DNA polymerase III subunit beta [Gammaproteobacteria bacterium]|jgi:DNA polymerase-3 subunit beta|nr:DNA polymerase III subunit beta [Gammaproteobacteria bacterium]
MKFSAAREAILKSLQTVVGVVERRQTMPILSNVLLSVQGDKLSVTATDLEVEMVAEAEVKGDGDGDITVPGRKLHDIFRALPEGTNVEISQSGDRVSVKGGRSRFTLSSLRAADFPTVEEIGAKQTLRLNRADLRRLVEKTHFSMAQQDVRYYLNGLLLETERKLLRAVATDGHRLALSEAELIGAATRDEQLIVPRKGVLELSRLLDGDGEVQLALGANHIRVHLDGIRLTSKLIDGRFPEYGRVVPAQPRNVLKADRNLFRQALQRTAILSNEKYRGVRLELSPNSVVLQANNPEQEEAVETLEVEYSGETMEIGFNVNYLLDALAAVDGEQVEFGVTDANSSCLIRQPGGDNTKFVVMPMRL